MATQPQTGLTYEDLRAFPEDNFRRELIDGELIVTAAPRTRHQDVVLKLGARLLAYTEEHGGKVYIAPTDVYFSNVNVVEPDVLFVRADNLDKVEKKLVRSAPDLIVEVSSPSTRKLELVRKRELYERFGVPEYWYVDIEVDQVQVYRLEQGYDLVRVLDRGDVLATPEIPGFSITIDDLFGPPED